MKNLTCDYLVFDISNLLYACFYADPNQDEETLVGLAAHSALVTLNKYFKMFSPRKRVIATFDRHSWRKDYTASEQCISKKPYKGNRRQNLSPSQQAKYALFCTHLQEFEKLLSEHTSITVLSEEGLEADDLIAGLVQYLSGTDEQIIIVSEDSDLQQLTRYSNVTQVGPVKGKVLDLNKYDDDPLYYLFQKCVRGDPTDNIQSAYPRVRQTRIKEAYEDPFKHTTLMKEQWVNEHGVTFTVEQLFEENQLLIDLSKQPEYIKDKIDLTLATQLSKKHKFSMFHLLQYLGKHKLVKIKDSIDQYLPMLSH